MCSSDLAFKVCSTGGEVFLFCCCCFAVVSLSLVVVVVVFLSFLLEPHSLRRHYHSAKETYEAFHPLVVVEAWLVQDEAPQSKLLSKKLSGLNWLCGDGSASSAKSAGSKQRPWTFKDFSMKLMFSRSTAWKLMASAVGSAAAAVVVVGASMMAVGAEEETVAVADRKSVV